MAVDYCDTCGNYRDIDYEECYPVVNGKYMCCSCCEDWLPEDLYEKAMDGEEVTYDPYDDEPDGHPSEHSRSPWARRRYLCTRSH